MYAKIFQQIYSSSIAHNYKQRLVFMDLLVLADRNGVVDMTHEGIARFTNVPLDIIREAIAELESPDPKSRNQEQAGARIVRLDKHRDWGWWIVNYERYRSIASEEQRREKTRRRVAQFRKRRNDVTLSNASVTLTNAGNAREREKEKQKEYSPKGESVRLKANALPWEAVCWNDNCGSLPKVQHVGPSRMRHLLARRKEEFWHKNFEAAMSKIFASKFCNGENDRGWVATFVWIVERPDALTKVIEGNYDNRKNSKERGRVNPRNEGICRGPTDYAALAKAKSALAHEEYLARVASSKAR